MNWVSMSENNIYELSAWTDKTRLDGLHLHNNNITTIPPALTNLTRLFSIDLGGNDITDVSVLGLGNMPNLQYISLWGNPIADATVLTGYTELHSLNFDNTGITALPVLPSSLRSLRANDSQVSDISGLAGLGNLNDVAFRNNRITTLPDLSGLTLITIFEINNNAIPALSLVALNALPAGAEVFSDVGRPAITGLTVSTNSVNLDVDTCFNLTVSGFDGSISYRGPVGDNEFGAGYADGQQTTICLHPNAANGIWNILRLDTNDGFTYNQFAVAQFGFNRPITVSGSAQDITAPVVTSITPTPQIIDLDNGPGLIDLNVVATDTGTGVTNIAVSYEDVDQQHQHRCCDGFIPLSVTTCAGVMRIKHVNGMEEVNNQTT